MRPFAQASHAVRKLLRAAPPALLLIVILSPATIAQQAPLPGDALPEKPEPQFSIPHDDGLRAPRPWRWLEIPPQSAPPSPPQSEQRAPAPAPPAAPLGHRFWNRENAWLFAGVAAMRALDFHSTGNMRRRGRQEILLSNDVVDNKPAFAAIEAAATLASVGISYLFHRSNHHKLERWTSIIHISVAGVGSVRNYCLKSHPVPPPGNSSAP
jgi:hypothetical protein